jgi:adenosylcobyric acid synthase
MGTYIHGIYDTPEIIRLWLSQIGLGHVPISPDHGHMERDQAYDRLAKHFKTHIDVEAIALLTKDRHRP